MSPDDVRQLPKVVLHDHLDGGLRPATVLDLADRVGYGGLPTDDVDELAVWFRQGEGADLSLERYIAAYDHTLAVMQTSEALARVAAEAVADHAADGVVHAELRFAPALHTGGGLSLDDVLEAVTGGAAESAREHGISVGIIPTVMRIHPPSTAIVELALRWTDAGVVGLDLAGPEAGFPAADHAEAFALARASGLHRTVHAGEADGAGSIRHALDLCHAERIGHGVRITDDLENGTDGALLLGPLAKRVRDDAIPLEVCPTSNLHTGAVRSAPAHPVDRLHRLGFNVTLNTDGRLMDGVSVTSELTDTAERFGWSLDDLHIVTRRAAVAAFLPEAPRRQLVDRVDAAFTAAGSMAGAGGRR